MIVAHSTTDPTDWSLSLSCCLFRAHVDLSRFVVRKITYTGELGLAVTALGSSTALLDVKSAELTTGGTDDASLVGGGVVAMRYKR